MRVGEKKKKKNIEQIFLEKLMRATKWKQLLTYWKKILEIGNNACIARVGQKKHMFFFGNARSKCNARAHLKQRKIT